MKVFSSKKVDYNSFGINKKLAKKFNALCNFCKYNTVLEIGCYGQSIDNIEYHREINRENPLYTEDYIEIITPKHNYQIEKCEEIYIDRKYNIVELRA